MAIGPTQSLQQRQSQTLSLTPELQQSLKMLQLSSMDLAEVIATELENNPLLFEPDANDYITVDSSEKEVDNSQMDLADLGKTENTKENESVLDYDYSQSWDDVPTRTRNDFSEGDFHFDKSLSKEKDFFEGLIEQFFLNVKDEKVRLIGLQLIDCLDDAGYFRGDLNEISENLGCEFEEVEATLFELQKLEPTGIFARNLCECLSLQLREKDRLDSSMFTLLSNLPLLGSNNFDILMDICDVDFDQLKEMVAEIKQLNPKPAANLTIVDMVITPPDILITKKDDGSFGIELNNAALPKVLLDKKYYTEVSAGAKDKEEKKYLTQKWQSANFLVRALEQRAETMLKTSAAIVKFQNEFFRFGLKYLKPLTLAQVAEEIGMHESTVSRVTSNKYMQTPRGNFEMKYFFTSGVANSGGEVASTSVKEMIREIIDAEEPNKPLSDDVITKLLGKRGIKISRRTVMKYREAMGIESSYDRKNSFALV